MTSWKNWFSFGGSAKGTAERSTQRKMVTDTGSRLPFILIRHPVSLSGQSILDSPHPVVSVTVLSQFVLVGEDIHQHITDNQPLNPYSEVRLLSAHTGPVHQIAKIDDKRFVSASDDHSAIVWDMETGQRLHTLGGHSERVTCVLPLQPCSDSGDCLIMTTSTDGTIMLWNLNADERFEEGLCFLCQKVIKEHNGSVKCLVQLSHDLVCSGGRDLCLWDRSGRLLSKCDRSQLEETSYIHSVLKLDSRHFGVVAASDYKSLAVYDIIKSMMSEMDRYELQFVRYLYSSHRENICCLTSISANLFASGSRDGVILLWSTNTLSAMKMFHCADTPPPRELTPPLCGPGTEIRYILVISERYLFAAIGNGFKVYDVIAYEDSQGHPKPLASHSTAHLHPITSMEFLEERSMLATASEDNTIRLWGSSNKLRRESDSAGPGDSLIHMGKISVEDFLGIELNPQRGRRKGSLPLPVVPMLLGELLLHSDHVKVVMDFGEHGLVTCGADNMVILWKNTEREREKRDMMIRSYLKGETL